MIQWGHLRLVVNNSAGEISMNMPMRNDASGPSPHRLAAQVVNLARAWAAEQDAGGVIPEIGTPAGLAQRDLMDAVHDLEYFESGAPTWNYRLPRG